MLRPAWSVTSRIPFGTDILDVELELLHAEDKKVDEKTNSKDNPKTAAFRLLTTLIHKRKIPLPLASSGEVGPSWRRDFDSFQIKIPKQARTLYAKHSKA
jgi:hypothetical protein